MVFKGVNKPLVKEEITLPALEDYDILVQVSVCGVCRTDLHIIDGDLHPPHLPLVLGHQIVGKVAAIGKRVKELKIGTRVGIPWLGKSCQACYYCKKNEENLCDNALFTGYDKNGGFAHYCVADSRFAFPLPDSYSDQEIAPFLCAGLIGYRALRMAGDSQLLGFYGFGNSARLLIQIAKAQGKSIYAFTRPQDEEGRKLAKSMGASWAGSSEEKPPQLLDAAIIFANHGPLVPLALQATHKGGIVVCAEIHMSDIPSFPYKYLWEERVLRSVANLTRQDGLDFFRLIEKERIHSQVTAYPLEDLNKAIEDLRLGRLSGAAVIVMPR